MANVEVTFQEMEDASRRMKQDSRTMADPKVTLVHLGSGELMTLLVPTP